MRPLVAPHFDKLVPYVPGKPIEETQREYGIAQVRKLASNENCLGPSPLAVAAMQRALSSTHLYPDAGGFSLKARLAQLYAGAGVTPAHLALGNGTNELIVLAARAFLGEGEALLNAWPSFICYRIAARALGREEVTVPLRADLGYDLDALVDATRKHPAIKLVFLAYPNNPTGRGVDPDELRTFAERLPADVVLVLDEAYAEYAPDPARYPDGIGVALRRPRTLVLRTFSKVYSLAALRIGYAVGDPALIEVLNRLRDAFNTSSLAQIGAAAALDDKEHVARSRAHNALWLPRLTAGLEARGFSVTPSTGNFVLAHRSAALPSISSLNDQLLRHGVIVRPVANYELPDSVRITVGTEEETAALFTALDDIRATHKVKAHAPHKHAEHATPADGIVVALDGPAGAGKSTVAKLVAARAGLALVDTGAIYRSVALLALRRNVSQDDGTALARIAEELSRTMRFAMDDGKNRVFVGDEEVTAAIRTPEVSAGASAVSRHPPVRAALLELQRALGKGGAVLEGRDIGTVVFPDAAVKAFVTASAEERARRRMKELDDKGLKEPFDKVLAEIKARDKQDSERPVAPLKPAPDAVVVDTTDKTLDAVVDEILRLIERTRAASRSTTA